jgi:signal transduction histidine kinase
MGVAGGDAVVEFPGGPEVTQKRVSAFKRELVWSAILFALMFGTVLALGSLILLRDLGDKEVIRMLNTYSKDLETQLKQVPSTQTLKGYQQQKVTVTRLNLFMAERKIFDSYKLYDEQGKLVKQGEVLRDGTFVEGDPPENLLPGQAQTTFSKKIPMVVDVPIEQGKVGKAIFSVSQEVLTRQAQEFRKEMMVKVLVMGCTILLLLAAAYLYVLRLLRLSRRIEFDAQKQERLSYLGLLSSGMAHEIKNPLNSIQMNLQLLEEEVLSGGDRESVRSWIDPIRKEIRRLEHLVNDFLLYARPMQPECRPFTVGPFLQAIAHFLEGEAAQRGVSLEVRVAPELPEICADEGLLRTALMNLVLNAIQSMPSGGKVRMDAGREGDRLRMDVVDTGPGIPLEKVEDIFQIFVTTKPGGTGLGLPIARRIAESHGGSLRAVPSGERGGKDGACMRMEVLLGDKVIKG